MIANETQGLKHLLKISLPYIAFSTVYSILILSLEEFIGDHIYKVSGQIGSVFGLAVAFFLGFRMNSAYDRWWEARKIFGELNNTTGSYATKAFVYLKNDKNILNANSKELSDDFLNLTILYIKQLKYEMHRKSNTFSDNNIPELFKKYRIDVRKKITNEILLVLTKLTDENFAANKNIEKSDLMQHINKFYEIQGKAERIRNTPFLKIYSIFTKITVFFYVLLLPLFVGDIDIGGENSNLELLSVPIMVVLSSVFLTINQLANLIGEPFSEKITSVPIDEICKAIENNCLDVIEKLETIK
jgi:putative membrane protein